MALFEGKMADIDRKKMNRRKRKRLFRKHRKLLDQVITILDEVEPMGLISICI